ncbi:MAG: bifunctional phosphoribosylaminoimidazolecarboxamide formyltransferase/IMP cyclohydrolase [Acidobacteria bacterium]|nr:bifunctional phosphoribosylaminoimidazolecarboxamide formyltransferase/IMP cyclohydrolase [Acidobacteriota bacterium]
MTNPVKIKRALLSVSDKTGLNEFAAVLAEFGVQMISTGGTARSLREAGFDVTDVSEVTGFPEMMDGRVKTLHPKIHGAFLALRDNEEHIAAMKAHDIEPIDLVVVNLYPFENTIANPNVTLEEAVENIDIGGPAMIRSASKNWRSVAVVTDAKAYEQIAAELRENDGSLSLETRASLAAAAYRRTSEYDSAITNYLSKANAGQETNAFLASLSLSAKKAADLRYGENPHQAAALYTASSTVGVANAEQLHGKEMSFNNYVDTDAAWSLVADLNGPAAAIIKHTNPSGVGVGSSLSEAYKRALSTDPVSAFGGIVAFNGKVDAGTARLVIEIFSEVVVAPDFDEDALDVFRTKKNLRVLKVKGGNAEQNVVRQISGGYLLQSADLHVLAESDLKVMTKRQPTDDEMRSMMLAWAVCKHVKSNAIVFANAVQTLGVGAGQMNRVDSVRIAASRAERFDLDLKGSAVASDAFFPFRDNVDEAARFGATAIIQPGGSVKDAESIEAADEHGIAMVFTGIRHFRH